MCCACEVETQGSVLIDARDNDGAPMRWAVAESATQRSIDQQEGGEAIKGRRRSFAAATSDLPVLGAHLALASSMQQ